VGLPSVVIVWFKRDLRVSDHAPLVAAAASGLPVLPLFIVETDYWKTPVASRRHWCFQHDCLVSLNQSLCHLGQSLIVRVADDALVAMQALAQTVRIQHIYAHEETGNDWTYQRDLRVRAWCHEVHVPLTEYPYNGVVRRLKSRDEWSAIRNQRMAQSLIAAPDHLLPLSVSVHSDALPRKTDPRFGPPLHGVVQKGGRVDAERTLAGFLEVRAKDYLYQISAPGASELSCSRLSTHLAYGVLSMKEVLHSLNQRVKGLMPDEKKAFSRSLAAFRSRLSWRDHFIQKIEDQPSIEYRCMHSGCEKMRPLPGNADFLHAWEVGQTGYPFIDACMRNLVYQGWITFRMRAMLVSFASYHLWLDWRETGHHLARTFTDYEPGIHYSQLQMQSGVTGINALRIYSPIKQSQEHDPEGKYIKQWVPELASVPVAYIHEPWTMPPLLQTECGIQIGQDYPAPIVDHQTAIRSAREQISAVRKQSDFRDKAVKVFQKLGSRRRQPQRRKKSHPKPSDDQLSMDLDD
jgi:deoxyribodipyrimidine photo-lyase